MVLWIDRLDMVERSDSKERKSRRGFSSCQLEKMRLILWLMVLYDIGDLFSIRLALRIGLEGVEYPMVIQVLEVTKKTNSSLMLAWREECLDLRPRVFPVQVYTDT